MRLYAEGRKGEKRRFCSPGMPNQKHGSGWYAFCTTPVLLRLQDEFGNPLIVTASSIERKRLKGLTINKVAWIYHLRLEFGSGAS